MARLFSILKPVSLPRVSPGAVLGAFKSALGDKTRRAAIIRNGLIAGLAFFCSCFVGAALMTGSSNGYPRVVLELPEDAHELFASHAVSDGVTGANEPAPQSFGLIENSHFGPLPRIASDGRTPATAFSREGESPDGKPVVSILVSGLGRQKSITAKALKDLDPNISLSFDPYSENLTTLVGQARRKGHEYFIEIPVEPFDFPANDAGPLALLVGGSQENNKERLHLAMSLATGYAGLVISGRSRFATDVQSLTPFLLEARRRGLLVFDAAASPVSKVPKLGRANHLQWGIADRRLDVRPTDEGIALQLLEIERIALEKGQAVAATDAYPFAVSRLESWVKTLPKKGLVLVPISVRMIDDNPIDITTALQYSQTPDPKPKKHEAHKESVTPSHGKKQKQPGQKKPAHDAGHH